MARPDSHPEHEQLREQILQRIAQLKDEISGKVDEVKGLSRFLGDHLESAEQAMDDALADVDSAEIQRDVTELRDARRALAQLDSGTYGICGRCSEPIPVARLQAQPLATYCIGCQEAVEKAV